MDKYDENAFVQRITAEKLVSSLSQKKFDKILEIGCGTGILTKQIEQNLVFQKYFANDIVEKSKNYIDGIISENTFVCGNAQKIKLPQKVDLIISNAVFQWFENLDKVLEYYSSLLKIDGIIAFSTFSPENFLEIREVTGLTLNYKNIDELKEIVEKNFEIIHIEKFNYKMNFSTPLQILAHMKNTGVNSLTEKHWGIKNVKEFCDKYREKFPELSLTYAPIIVVAKKK
ncbi:MAG: malonyl-ACP O-methyltransferase BioC [Brachyspira sp.]|nr:malonyl-ACP O-methyltransferase BioC [Brachyspira sp.]